MTSRTINVILVSGTRPNLVKIAPLLQAIRKSDGLFNPLFLHTGQHYDYRMSESLMQDLGMPPPDICLAVGSASHARQTGRIMMKFEKVLREVSPRLVVVVGDVNSTLACALTAAKERIPVAHVEAGLRSFDTSMPEEINRKLTDAISDYLFAPSPDAQVNLENEGVPASRIFLVGNIMIDTLLAVKPRAEQLAFHRSLGLEDKRYAVVTLHRPSNVDDRESLLEIAEAFVELSTALAVVFPVHPRTKKRLRQFGILSELRKREGIVLLDPVNYTQMISLALGSSLVMTDSGGLQEETTVLGVPCLTLRENTERPITVSCGTNRVVGNRKDAILDGARMVLDGGWRPGRVPDLWDGHSASRIIETLAALYN